MAESRRGLRGPQGKVPQDSVLRVNVDVRAGVPRATVLQPGQQFLNGGSRTGVGISPDVPHQHRSHNTHVHQQQSLPAAHRHYHHHPAAAHNTRLHAHYRESLDEPPKYDDIFKSHVNTEPSHLYQGQHKSYEKRHLKSYLLRHFPKAKTVNNRNRGTCVINGGVNSPESGSVISGPSQRYTQINIPRKTQVEYPTPPTVGGAPPPQMRPSEAEQEQQQQQQFRQPQQFRHHQQQQQQQQQQEGNRKFTITLKPGNYRVNVQWRSKTHPFRITLTPKKKTSKEAPPPAEQQPLYYGTCNVHQEEHVPDSLPRRLVHRLLFRPHSSTVECDHRGGDDDDHDDDDMSPAQLPQCSVHLPNLQQQVTQQQLQLLQQQVGTNPVACGSRKGQKRCWEGVGPRHRQRKSRYRLAERKKNEGNEYYKNKEYREALKLYTQAIDLCPDCAAYYSNRSACYMMLGKYYEALNDAREAVRLDTSFVKGYLRVAKCNIALGDATAALSVLRQAGEIEPNNRAIREEVTKAQNLVRCQDEVAKATAKADYRTAIFHLDRALELAVGCRSLKITKAEYLVFLQRYGDAQEIVNDILQYDSGNADAIYVRGMCLYYQDNPDAAFSHFQHVLRLAPDHQKARDVYKKAKLLKQKKEEGNEAFKKGNYQEAFNLYTDALATDPLNKHTNAKLYFNRATVGSKLNKLEQAMEDCTAAINLDDGYVKAYLRRAHCYQLLEKHEEAVRDYERITKLDRSQEHKRLLQEAKIQLKRSKRKDYYKILGVNKNASDDEIKKSYRKMALVHHPDRHANASEKDKHEHEIKFKEIGEAYSVLTDAKKRAMYDRGQDINDPDGGFAHEGDIDPNQIFQAFFGGGHGGYSFGGHNAGFQQGGFPGTGFTGASFPGGFHFQFG